MKAVFRKMAGKASLLAQIAVMAVVAVALGAAIISPNGIKNAFADTQNYPPGTSVYAIPIHLSGTNSTELSSVAAIKMPYGARLVGFSAKSRAFGTGATPTPKVDLRAGATSVLSTPLTLSTVGVTEATIATAAIADETTLSVDLSLTGVSSVSDTTLLMTFVR